MPDRSKVSSRHHRSSILWPCAMLSIGWVPLVPFEIGDHLYGQPFSFSPLGQLEIGWMIFLTLPISLLLVIWLIARLLGFLTWDDIGADLNFYKFPRISSITWPLGLLAAGWVPLIVLTLIFPRSEFTEVDLLCVAPPLCFCVHWWLLLKILGRIA